MPEQPETPPGGQTQSGRRPPRKRGSTRRTKCATSANGLRRAALKKRIIDLRVEGLSIRAIEERLRRGGWKTSKSDVQSILAEELQSLGASRETKEQARELSLVRLETWLAALGKRAKKGDEKAITVSKSLDERIAKYLGTEAPAEQHVKLTVLGQLNWIFDIIERELGPDAARRVIRRIGEEGGPPTAEGARGGQPA